MMRFPGICAISLAALSLFFDASLAGSSENPPENPCDSAAGIMEKACKDAKELLLREPSADNAETTVRVTLGSDGWRYQFDGMDGETCPDPGALTIRQGGRVDVVATSKDQLYDWSVPALGIDTTLIPGRIVTVPIDAAKAGQFPGVMSIIGVSAGSVEILAPAAFTAWRAATAERSC